MRLTFLGAAKTVTGSKYLIETDGRKILVDCGLFQGYKELRMRNWENFPVDPSEIDCIILTHAHLDHSGYIPLMVKQGFSGPVYCTHPTYDLCKLLLPDSGYIQEEDARRANRYRYSKHDPALPLYTLADAEEALKYFEPKSFKKEIKLSTDTKFRFERNGHILGASWVLFESEGKSILFSGDIGRPNDPVMKSPEYPVPADYIVVESTYGDRLHEEIDPLDQLEPIIKRTSERGGIVIIPSFAVGRAQSIIYYLYQLKTSGRMHDIPVYLDSPMAVGATDIMEKYLEEHRLDKNLCHKVMRSVEYVHTADQSKKLDAKSYPKIIIAASGMATGGRVLHHLEHLAPDYHNTILFAGFQAGGTRGDRILKGETEVKIHGQMIPINAEVACLDNISAHADYKEILYWLQHIKKAPTLCFITHGEELAASSMQSHIESSMGWKCKVPELGETFEL